MDNITLFQEWKIRIVKISLVVLSLKIMKLDEGIKLTPLQRLINWQSMKRLTLLILPLE